MSTPTEDPAVGAARREAAVAIAIWLVAMIATVGLCYRFGYGGDRSPDELSFVLWFPDWIFWGLIVPWLACSALSVWFAFGFMRDVPLEEEPAGGHDLTEEVGSA